MLMLVLVLVMVLLVLVGLLLLLLLLHRCDHSEMVGNDCGMHRSRDDQLPPLSRNLRISDRDEYPVWIHPLRLYSLIHHLYHFVRSLIAILWLKDQLVRDDDADVSSEPGSGHVSLADDRGTGTAGIEF